MHGGKRERGSSSEGKSPGAQGPVMHVGYSMGLASCTAAVHIGVVHSLICRAGMNQ